MESLLGDYYTAISIIIVYHLFSVQHWLDRVTDLDTDAESVRRSTAIGDLARERVRLQCVKFQKIFPRIQIALLFVAISALIYMAIRVALDLANIPYLYSIGPVVVLWLVFVTTTMAVWLKGRGMLKKTAARL